MRSAVIAALILASPGFAQKVNPRASGWHSDYATAKAEAKRTGKPLFVAFRCEP